MRRQVSVVRHQVPLSHLLLDGARFSGLFGALVVGSMKYNPRIWQPDAPRAIQEQAGPMTATDKRQRLAVSVPLLGLMLGFPIYSNLRLRRRNGGSLAFASAFVNAFGVFALGNLFDLVAIDYLLIVRLRPDFAVFPGTAGMAEYGDVGFHLRGLVKGLGIGLVYSAFVAWLTRR